MANSINKILMLVFLFSVTQFVDPLYSTAARIAGENAPVQTVQPSNQKTTPDAAPVPRPAEKAGKREPSARTQANQKSSKGAVSPSPGPVASPPKATPERTAGKAVAQQKQKTESPRYVTIDFDNVDIQVFIKFVSELTGKNFVIDDKVRGKVTIISPQKISIEEVYQVFESVLEVNGFAAVEAGDITKIVPALQAREKKVETTEGRLPSKPEDKIITQIISLEHASPDDVKKILDPLISRTSLVLSYPPTGMLVITDYQSNIQRILQIIGSLDVEGVAAQITYLPLKYARASDVAKSLSTLFQQQPQRGAAIAPIRIVPDERVNALILVASEIETERIRKLIDLMDKAVPTEESMLRVYRLQNAVAEDLAKVLMNIPKAAGTQRTPYSPRTPAATPGQPAAQPAGQSPLLSKDVQILADKATNTLIVMADKDDYKVLEEIIRSLDISRPMVYIEALIMEVNVTKNFQVGVEWRTLKDTGSISGFDTGETAAFVGSGGLGAGGQYAIIPGLPTTPGAPINFPGGFAVGILGAGITVGDVFFPNIGAVVQAFRRDSDVSILSTPQIMTLDNEEAEITVGKNVPYITRQENTSGLTTGINYSTFEYKDVGVTLNVTPHINEENYVRLSLNQKTSSVVQAESTIGLPTTLKRETKTTIVVKDRETVVIGGLLGDSTDAATYQVPCLGNIPIFGWLFKSMARTRDKTNLYVFLTPHIIRTQSEASALYKEKRNEMGEVKEGVIKLNEYLDKKGPASTAPKGK